MAEIKIEKKKPVWPWIIALLLIAGVIYFIFFRDNAGTSETTMEVENPTSENIRIQNKKEAGLNINSAIASFVNYEQPQCA